MQVKRERARSSCEVNGMVTTIMERDGVHPFPAKRDPNMRHNHGTPQEVVFQIGCSTPHAKLDATWGR